MGAVAYIRYGTSTPSAPFSRGGIAGASLSTFVQTTARLRGRTAAGYYSRRARTFGTALIVRTGNQIAAQRIILVQLAAFFGIFTAEAAVCIRRHLKRIAVFTLALGFHTRSSSRIRKIFTI